MATIRERFARSLKSLSELNVVTAVGDTNLVVNPDGTTSFAAQPTGQSVSAKAIYTKIDLVDGDMVNLIDREFYQESEQRLMTFHQQQVQNAREIIRNNANTVIKLVESTVEKVQGLLDEAEE